MATFVKARQKWKALACHRPINKQVFLGYYATEEEARDAEKVFREKHPLTGQLRGRATGREYKDPGLQRNEKGWWLPR